MPVAVVFTVSLVVFFVVADEVLQGETVMGGDEVDARPGTTAAIAEDVGRAGDARGEFGNQPLLALPIAAHRSAVLRVPLGPARRNAQYRDSVRRYWKGEKG